MEVMPHRLPSCIITKTFSSWDDVYNDTSAISFSDQNIGISTIPQ